MQVLLSKLIIIISVMIVMHACEIESKSTYSGSIVSIEKSDGQSVFMVNGSPFKIKGAGMGPNLGSNYQTFKEAGGNAFRTWSTREASVQLDSAAHFGFMVALGLDIGQELHGFDYDDEQAVAEQFERIKKEIDKYKDHPNLLCWVAGNELDLLFDVDGGLIPVNPKVYDALAQIVDYIHEVDPHHPVTTTFAGVHPKNVELTLKFCPQIDFLSFQVYGGLLAIEEEVDATIYDGPYLITEFGPLGHWEMPHTSWGREIEEASTPKAKHMIDRMISGFDNNQSGNCLGGFVFYWGQKQERTPTWYGLFLKTGEHTERVDELTKYWTGSYPEHRAPQVDSLLLNDQNPVKNIRLKPGAKSTAQLFYRKSEGSDLKVIWELRKEVQERSQGGAHETEPEMVQIQIQSEKEGTLVFSAPASAGDYRLFAYVFDENGKVGYANIPFYVTR